MIDAYVIYGNDSEPKTVTVPDDFFISHDRANGWRSCFPTLREARDFADMARKVEAVLKEIFTQKKCNTQTNNG
jgi:hypothetical protein